MVAAPRRFHLQTCKLQLTLKMLFSGCRMIIFLHDVRRLGGIAHLLVAFEYGCRHLDTHGYTQSLNTHGRACCLPCVDMNHLRCRPITSRSVTF